MLTNLFGDMALDVSIKNIIRKIASFSFAPDSSLRVSGAVTVSSGTVTTVSTVSTMSTGNISIGDSGKSSTIISSSATNFYCTVGRNFNRQSIGEF